MFIGTVQTKYREEYQLKTEDFSEAWNFLHKTAEQLAPDVVYAAVLEDVRWSDGHYLHPNKEIAVMRTIR